MTALLALLFNVTFSAVPAAASTTIYTAVSSGDWTSPATWSDGVTPPLATTSAVITIARGLTVTISSATTVSAGGIVINNGALVVAGTLNIAGSLSNYLASLTVNAGGTLSVAGAPNASIYNQGSVLTNHGTFDVRAGGTLENLTGALVESDGVFEIFAGGRVDNLNNVSQITNDTAGTLINDAGAVFLNEAQVRNDGSFINQAGATLTNYVGFTSFGSITNHGAIDVNAGGVANFGSMSNDGALNVYANNGFFNDHSATFVNDSGGSVLDRGIPLGIVNVGAIVNAHGATFTVWTGFLNEVATFANHGQLLTTNVATITNDGNAFITNYSDGSIVIGRYGTLKDGDTTIGYGTINSYGPIENDGRIEVPFGALNLASGSVLENHGAIASSGIGFVSNAGTLNDYCADGATVTGTVRGNPVQFIGCTTTFTQTGIPSATWGVSANGAHYTGSGASIAVNGLTGTVSYGYDATIVSGATRYDCASGCSGSMASGGTAAASYRVSYLVHYQATGCALPVPVPSDAWVASGTTAPGSLPSSVYSNDNPASTLCALVSDDRPAMISGPTTITATYHTSYLLSVSNGASTSSGYELAGTPITLTADIVPGMVFVDWQVDATTYPAFTGTIAFTMDAPHVATAVYETPAQATQTFVGAVDGSGLPAGITQSLDAKLNAAAAALGHGATVAATGQLGAFVNAVHAQTGKGIPTGQATFFTAVAQAILAALH